MAGRDTLRKKLPPEISCCQYITIVGSGGFYKKIILNLRFFLLQVVVNPLPSLEVGELIRKSFSIRKNGDCKIEELLNLGDASFKVTYNREFLSLQLMTRCQI